MKSHIISHLKAVEGSKTDKKTLKYFATEGILHQNGGQ